MAKKIVPALIYPTGGKGRTADFDIGKFFLEVLGGDLKEL